MRDVHVTKFQASQTEMKACEARCNKRDRSMDVSLRGRAAHTQKNAGAHWAGIHVRVPHDARV